MRNNIGYYWGKEDLQIRLGNRIEPRIRIIYWIEFLVTAGIATIVLLTTLNIEQNWMMALADAAIGSIYLFAAYRFLSKMFFRESLTVTKEGFAITQKTPFKKRNHYYHWTEMGSLHYAGKGAKTDHPLKGKCFDYFGFDTQEQLVQDLHHDGNLFFESGGKQVRFARGIYSWHAEEIIRMITLFSGSALTLGEEWNALLGEIDWWQA